MNSIQIIHPYKYFGAWVFDDANKELEREAFETGIEGMIDNLTRNIPDAGEGFNLYFSARPFPGYTLMLEWERRDEGGNWYHCPQLGISGWLCPALLKYFLVAPLALYIQAKGGN